jgi:CheY-like chemotaxis protein/anti-sigma regulatory factor (Ser/Thr protein kinase)
MELRVAPFDLENLIAGLDGMVRLRCEQKNLGWKFESVIKGETWVRGDENKLRQVLINLMSNAVKFTDRGSVGLVISGGEDGCYTFEVNDTGPGISEADQARLFEPFTQGESGRKKGGTGLGLAISRRQLEIMGSRFEVASAPGVGTRFRFTVRLPSVKSSRGDTTPVLTTRAVHVAPGCRVRALVVDDVADNRNMLRAMLELAGVEALLASDGQQALEAMESNRLNIVFLDIRMPGMDGNEVIRTALNRYGARAPKFVAVTASVFFRNQEQCLRGGFDVFLAKPIDRNLLHQTLERLFPLLFVRTESADVMVSSKGRWESARMPEDIKRAIQQYAQIGSAGDISKVLTTLRALGPDEAALADRLQLLSDSYEMDAILSLIESHDTQS